MSDLDLYPSHQTGAGGITTTVGTTPATHACSAVPYLPAAPGMAPGYRAVQGKEQNGNFCQ